MINKHSFLIEKFPYFFIDHREKKQFQALLNLDRMFVCVCVDTCVCMYFRSQPHRSTYSFVTLAKLSCCTCLKQLIIVPRDLINYIPYRPKAKAHLIPGNDQMSNAYFWKVISMRHQKMGILNLASRAVRLDFFQYFCSSQIQHFLRRFMTY